MQKQHIPHREDASNATDFCLRNRLRHHVVPRLTAENPALETAWLETARQLREEDAYLSDLAQVAMLDARQGNGFSIARVQALHPALRARVLFGFLQTFGVRQPRREHVRQLEALLASQSASGRLSLPGVCLARNYEYHRACGGVRPGASVCRGAADPRRDAFAQPGSAHPV